MSATWLCTARDRMVKMPFIPTVLSPHYGHEIMPILRGGSSDWTCGFYPFTLDYNENNRAMVEWEPDLVSKVLGSNPTSSAWRLCSTEQGGRFSTSNSSSISKEVIRSAGSEAGWEINTGKLSMCLQHNRSWGKVSFLPSLRSLEANR